MARTRVLGDDVLRVSSTLVQRVPGVVTATTGVDNTGAASATGATVNVFDPRSPAKYARPGSIQNTDGATVDTWDFTAMSGVKLSTATTLTANTAGTMSKPAGKFILTSGNAAYTLTNTFVSPTSVVDVQMETSGDTVNIKSVVPGTGSFVLTMSGNVAADSTFSFVVINGN